VIRDSCLLSSTWSIVERIQPQHSKMKTRRSKGNETVHDEVQTIEVELPSDFDVDQLAEMFPNVQLRQPNSQTIAMVYKSLLEQSHSIHTLNLQIEEMRSENMRKEIELDQTLQEHDVRFKELEQNLSLKSSEVDSMKRQNEELCSLSIREFDFCASNFSLLVASRDRLEIERDRFNQHNTASASEVESLKVQVTEHEREKRDLVGIIARLRSENEDGDRTCKSFMAIK
jgi:TolA-binding protein